MMLGYTYQKGGRGRGNSARFIYNKRNDKIWKRQYVSFLTHLVATT
jgi:hypothetical protein